MQSVGYFDFKWCSVILILLSLVVGLSLDELQFTRLQQQAVRYSIPLTANPADARCMDGSPVTYYLRRGHSTGRSSWILFFEGGGWCWDAESCFSRIHMFRGSSLDYPDVYPDETLKEYLSNDPLHNPLLYNWNMVYIRYCDGSSYAGDARIPYKVQFYKLLWLAYHTIRDDFGYNDILLSIGHYIALQW